MWGSARLQFVPAVEEDHDQYFGGPSNQTLHVAYRMFRMTDFLHSGGVSGAWGRMERICLLTEERSSGW